MTLPPTVRSASRPPVVSLEPAAPPAMPPPVVLCAQALTVRAAGRMLLQRFTQGFEAGQLWCIAGPNGAGKTTLLQLLAGLQAAAEGVVTLDGKPLPAWQPAALARRRALLAQTTHDAFGASVFDTVMLGRYPHLGGWGWDSDTDRAIVRRALQLFGLMPLLGRDVRSLSGGERQRVALAALFAQQAPLLLLDEPLAWLDVHHQIECMVLLREQAHTHGAAVLMSCHDLTLARRFCSHAALLDGHGAAYCGVATEVLTAERVGRAFGHPFVLIESGGREALVPADLPRVSTLPP